MTSIDATMIARTSTSTSTSASNMTPTANTTSTGITTSNTSLTSSTASTSHPKTKTPWLRYVGMIVILPFLMGVCISMGLWYVQQQSQSHHPQNNSHARLEISMSNFLSTVSWQTQRLLSYYRLSSTSSNSYYNFISNGSNTSTNTVFIPNMDMNRCFQQLERYMFESQPQWDAFNIQRTTIFLHRNGQAEACGNSSWMTTIQPQQHDDDGNGDVAVDVNVVADDNASSSSSTISMKTIFQTSLQELHDLGQACPDFSNKYHVESFLTRVLVHLMTPSSSTTSSSSVCHSEEDDIDKRHTQQFGLYDYCDMGEDKTPLLLDHNKLIPNTIVTSATSTDGSTPSQPQPHGTVTLLPCHFHTEHGLRVTSLLQWTRLLLLSSNTTESIEAHNTNCVIAPNGEETCETSNVPTTNAPSDGMTTLPGLHLYAVPAGRVFMHVAAYIGQIIALDHVPGADPTQQVYLKVLSVSPAVFDLYNFFTKDESNELVQRALSETKESHRIKRSTTGTGEHNVNTRRTSESGFDTEGATSILIKKYVASLYSFIHSFIHCNVDMCIGKINTNHLLSILE